MYYRVEQFISAITAKMTKEDTDYVKGLLNEKEQELFFKLKVYEQVHCLRVARNMDAESGVFNIKERWELSRIALLHDIGKIKYPLNPIEKSIIVVLNKLTKGKIRKLTKLKMVKCYYTHAQEGAALLAEIGTYNEDFLEAIRTHHDVDITSEKMNLLQKCDNAA
ncbi:HD domain-containing protein [Cellulosilyticum ruminicola]|uniref:HD domain-containing protein n=1 Tax=Cellulosilyticum ruminicola TaxID=425254 RepID=UPI0006D16066|nr:HD domain-containing protein [Cellulosilyticum ruminicola]